MSKNCGRKGLAIEHEFSLYYRSGNPPRQMSHCQKATLMKYIILVTMFFVSVGTLTAQAIRDGFDRAATTDLAGSEKWRKVLDLTAPSASMQINPDSTISPYNPLGVSKRGAVYWDSALSGRFQVGVVLRHKSGGNNTPVFHLQVMDDSSWFTGNGYGLRFQENAGLDRFDIQDISGSGTDTPFVTLLGTANQELSEDDTLMFKFYEDGTKAAVLYGTGGLRDSIVVVDTFYNPASWYVWIQAVVFADSVKLDDFMVGPIPYEIAATAGPGGAISPAGTIAVNPGDDTSFTFIPDVGFGLADVLVDSVSVGTPAGYTFTGVSTNHTIAALFDTLVYTITASASANGSITPSGPVSVNYGTGRSFTVAPDPGFHLDSLLVDGVPVDSTSGFTFGSVTADHTISAFFSVNVYTIAASAGPHGSITPSGAVPVTHGASQSFTVTPDGGYFVDTMFVDGIPVDSVNGYTFSPVTTGHTISVTFTGIPAAGVYPVRENWNIVSLPLTVPDFLKTTLYPDASSGAYAYSAGYVAYDTLSNGPAYWIKFPEDDSIPMAGFLRAVDTVDVDEGWNMVGSISVPVPVANVVSIPGGLVSSGFFGYEGSYVLSPTIEPGRGYWVKMDGAGKLVLSDTPAASPTTALRVVPTSDLPPPPPSGAVAEIGAGILPSAFSLSQNYPNPFNPTTRIEFTLPVESYVRLTVYNVLGEEVSVLADGVETAGLKSVTFDAGGLPSGIYTYRLIAGDFSGTGRMLLLK